LSTTAYRPARSSHRLQAAINADIARGDTFETWVMFGDTSGGGALKTGLL